MILNKLSVLNYKNIRQAEIACSSKMNCFVKVMCTQRKVN